MKKKEQEESALGKQNLNKLKRSELLELLLDRSKEVEHLRIYLEDANRRIAEYEEQIKQIGSLDESIENLKQVVDQVKEGIHSEKV